MWTDLKKFIAIDYTMFPRDLACFEIRQISCHSGSIPQQKQISVKFQATSNRIQRESEASRDICIDQGFTFTHTPLLSQAVIQGLFGLASNSSSAVWGFTHTQGRISNETPKASQHLHSLAFLMLHTGLPCFNNSRIRDFCSIAKELHNYDNVMDSYFLT